mgnify:CR=1 FL=1
MSIPVALAELASAMSSFDYAFFLTVSDGARPHAVAVSPVWTADGSGLAFEGGRRTCANASARPDVSLVFPPREPGGYSLIVDGSASVDGGGSISVRPETAVLHRPAPADHTPEPGACGADCQPIMRADEGAR